MAGSEYHSPALAIYKGKISNPPAACKASMTGIWAVMIETSCSTDWPPKMTRTFFMLVILADSSVIVRPVVLNQYHVAFHRHVGQGRKRRRSVIVPVQLTLEPSRFQAGYNERCDGISN